MIIESILILFFALLLDFSLGDPKNRYHPTAWMGRLIAKIIPFAKSENAKNEKIFGVLAVLFIAGIVATITGLLQFGLKIITLDVITLIISTAIGAILLKTTIAIRGMEKHAMAVIDCIEKNDIESARSNLSMIVKRNTKNLDKNHVLSGVLESVSENTVDGITGPLFYYSLFGLPGAFVYRAINTIDSMIGYKTRLFNNLGWFGAKCDSVLNFVPARLTGFVMVIGSAFLGYDWKSSLRIMLKDGKKIDSLNAGYPMAALAGALQTKFEKLDHYELGVGDLELSKQHIKSSIDLMRITSVLFCCIIVIPIIIALSYLGWWIHA